MAANLVTSVFTDGACIGNPGPGGWAFVVDGGAWASGAEPDTTNQRMELTAASAAVQALDGPLRVVSDSTYVVNCFNQGWWKGWHKRGWKNSQRQPVANRDLWEPFIDLVNARGDVEFEWVKGHAGHRLNDAADRLATTAAAEQKGRSGDRFSDSIVAELDADEPRSYSATVSQPVGELDADPTERGGRVLGDPTQGHLIAVVGHRPPELGGYQENPVTLSVRRKMIDILRAKKELHPDLVVATGLGLGTEMLAAEAAAAAAVPFVAVLAFEGIDAKWPQATRRRFRELLDDAGATVVVSSEAPKSGAEFGKAMGRRDDWLTRHATEAIVVRRSDDRTLGDVHRKLERTLGDDEVWVLEPE
jgi:ribonuclease HI